MCYKSLKTDYTKHLIVLSKLLLKKKAESILKKISVTKMLSEHI